MMSHARVASRSTCFPAYGSGGNTADQAAVVTRLTTLNEWSHPLVPCALFGSTKPLPDFVGLFEVALRGDLERV
jgi:hypothetical protein